MQSEHSMFDWARSSTERGRTASTAMESAIDAQDQNKAKQSGDDSDSLIEPKRSCSKVLAASVRDGSSSCRVWPSCRAKSAHGSTRWPDGDISN